MWTKDQNFKTPRKNKFDELELIQYANANMH